MSCTALAFGWVWSGEKRWRAVSDLVSDLDADANGSNRRGLRGPPCQQAVILLTKTAGRVRERAAA